MADETELVERLRLKEHRGKFTLGGGSIGADGSVSGWGGEKIMEYRNPDGPAAADTIEELQRERDAMREGLNAIMDRGPERDIKWAGMNAHDIARAALSGEAS